jgi:hypothetical protein
MKIGGGIFGRLLFLLREGKRRFQKQVRLCRPISAPSAIDWTSSSGEADPPCQQFDALRRNGRSLLQQWRDESAFFGQKRFGYEKERVVSGTFFNSVCRQDGGAHC